MSNKETALLGEVIGCRKLLEDYANRLDAACDEYYDTGKTLFPNLSRAEDEDIDHHCLLILSHLSSAIPDAISRWENIKYPSGQYTEQVERLRDFITRRRNLFRIFESSLNAKLNSDSSFTKSAGESKKNNLTTVLFLAADPTDATRLRLGQEFREIKQNLQKANMRESFRLALPQLSITAADISQALLDEKPTIVHFSGHGTEEGELCFEETTGKMLIVQPTALAALFKLVSTEVECVILNACFSATQIKEISKYINYVIGMNKAIGDRAAVSFSIGFYQALGAGRTIEEAFEFGCVQIGLQNIPEQLTPVLIKKQ